MNGRARLIALVAVAAGLVAFLKRPVRQPEPEGTWQPVDRQSTRR